MERVHLRRMDLLQMQAAFVDPLKTRIQHFQRAMVRGLRNQTQSKQGLLQSQKAMVQVLKIQMQSFQILLLQELRHFQRAMAPAPQNQIQLTPELAPAPQNQTQLTPELAPALENQTQLTPELAQSNRTRFQNLMIGWCYFHHRMDLGPQLWRGSFRILMIVRRKPKVQELRIQQ